MDREAFEFGKTIRHDIAVIGQRNSRKRHSVRGVGISADRLPQHVYHPVCRLASGNERNQRPCGRPHDVASRLVILRVPVCDAARMKQGTH